MLEAPSVFGYNGGKIAVSLCNGGEDRKKAIERNEKMASAGSRPDASMYFLDHSGYCGGQLLSSGGISGKDVYKRQAIFWNCPEP